MNPTVSTIDSQMSSVFVGSMEPLGTDTTTQQLPLSNMHTGLLSPIFSLPVSQEMLTSFEQEQSESMSNNLDCRQYSMPNSEVEQTEIMHVDTGQESSLLPNKRKAAADPTSNGQMLQKMSIPNKRVAQVGSSPRSPGTRQPSVLSKRTPEMQSKSPRMSTLNKKVEQIDLSMNKSQPACSKNRNLQSEASSGTHAETFESVRAKLRESLTAALALVSEQKSGSSDGKKKNEKGAAVTTQNIDSRSLGSASTTADTTATEACDSNGPYPSNKCSAIESVSQEVHTEDVSEEGPQTWKFVGQEFQGNPVLPGDDAQFTDGFFFKDELLQGNGLSWALELDTQITEVSEVDNTQKGEPANHNVSEEKEQVDQSPESLALQIESELFKLFGSVNKKYKEKGRSLLFNLKDRNNPELRERVMSGEISPERLCSMTAEELASKELSQWRMAKAEELDHMKVLPDTEGDVRRLVKKTHKGEYQVEFDQDVTVVEDVPLNTSLVSQSRPKKNGSDVRRYRKADGAKDYMDGQCRITIPVDGADMHGLMVDDVRDLPPIVSLDEFMESLDKEPPFEILPADPGTTTPVSHKESPKYHSESKSPLKSSKDYVESTSHDNKVVGAESTKKEHSLSFSRPLPSVKQDADVKKSTVSHRALDVNHMSHQKKAEHIWQGSLQLSLSSTASVMAIYISGEKACTKEWPRTFEIKGRVRLDPFDKFLQDLPMSRSRAIMVAHFVLKEGCQDSEHAELMELIDSYIMDQRLGFAEPVPGVELYLCPPHSRPVDMVISHLPKEFTEKINDINNGLIGILVWKKERIAPAISPNTSTTQLKHTAKVQLLTPGRRPHDRDVIHRNVNFASRVAATSAPSLSKPTSNDGKDDNDDDVPPGFGPSGGGRDDDDLPEFNFSGPPISNPNTNPVRGTAPTHLRPGAVAQMRELIQKYGQSGNSSDGNGIPIQPWNSNDEDDDIPEWQPHASHLPVPPSQKPVVMPHMNRPVFQQHLAPLAKPLQPLQPPMTGHGAWWPSSGPNNMRPPSNIGGRPVGGQYHGMPPNRDWRPPNASSRNRGF